MVIPAGGRRAQWPASFALALIVPPVSCSPLSPQPVSAFVQGTVRGLLTHRAEFQVLSLRTQVIIQGVMRQEERQDIDVSRL